MRPMTDGYSQSDTKRSIGLTVHVSSLPEDVNWARSFTAPRTSLSVVSAHRSVPALRPPLRTPFYFSDFRSPLRSTVFSARFSAPLTLALVMTCRRRRIYPRTSGAIGICLCQPKSAHTRHLPCRSLDIYACVTLTRLTVTDIKRL